MGSSRSYSSGVVPALVLLSGGTCYWPGCGERVIREVDGRPVLNVQVAHIRAANPGGPRYVEQLPDEERNAFANLILLCHPHHTTVDTMQRRYTVGTLQGWKSTREVPGLATLRGLSELTEERLSELIGESLRRNRARTRPAAAPPLPAAVRAPTVIHQRAAADRGGVVIQAGRDAVTGQRSG